MYAIQLIGKLAIRKAPVDRGEREVGSTGVITRNVDNSFTNDPILILAATDSHIVFKCTKENRWASDYDKKKVLNYEYCDDNWVSWDDLMNLASDEHIELMQKLQE